MSADRTAIHAALQRFETRCLAEDDFVALWIDGAQAASPAAIGGTLTLPDDEADVLVRICLRDPEAPNHRGKTPTVRRVDLIVGQVTGPADDRTQDTNSTTRVVRRFTGGRLDTRWRVPHRDAPLEDVSGDHYYLRVRGTNTYEPDPLGEDPRTDLWFYAIPIFLDAP